MASRSNDPAYWQTKTVEFRRRALGAPDDAAAMLRARADEFAIVAAELEALTGSAASTELPLVPWRRTVPRPADLSRGLAAVGATFIIGYAIGATGHLPWQGGRAASSISKPPAPAPAVTSGIALMASPAAADPKAPMTTFAPLPAERPIVTGTAERSRPEADTASSIAIASGELAPASVAVDAPIGLPQRRAERLQQASFDATFPPVHETVASSTALTTSRAVTVSFTECRAYTVSNTTAGTASVRGIACRLPDGRWKLSPGPPTH